MCQKVKTAVFFIYDQLLGALIYLNFIIDINLFLIDDAWCNNVVCGYSSARTTPGVSLYRSLTLEEKYCCSYFSR